MSDIGKTLCFLDQNLDALKYFQQALGVLRRALPDSDPELGGYYAVIAPHFNAFYAIICLDPGRHMVVTATILRALGRYNDALVLQEEVVDFYKRVLPPNDPRIGTVAQRSAYFFAVSLPCCVTTKRQAVRCMI